VESIGRGWPQALVGKEHAVVEKDGLCLASQLGEKARQAHRLQLETQQATYLAARLPAAGPHPPLLR
jgi:hypothetical protein